MNFRELTVKTLTFTAWLIIIGVPKCNNMRHKIYNSRRGRRQYFSGGKVTASRGGWKPGTFLRKENHS